MIMCPYATSCNYMFFMFFNSAILWTILLSGRSSTSRRWSSCTCGLLTQELWRGISSPTSVRPPNLFTRSPSLPPSAHSCATQFLDPSLLLIKCLISIMAVIFMTLSRPEYDGPVCFEELTPFNFHSLVVNEGDKRYVVNYGCNDYDCSVLF